jgi:hypothetical protein
MLLIACGNPIEDLAPRERDISLFLIAPNSVLHAEANADPVFRADIKIDIGGITAYGPYRWVSPIACADRHKICSPVNNACTPLQGSKEAIESARGSLNLNLDQIATVERLAFELPYSSFYHQVWMSTQGFLRAQESVAGLRQQPLPDNQWEIEMAFLFSDAMSKLQHTMLEYPTGPSVPGNVQVLRQWESPALDSPPEVLEGLESQRRQFFKQRVKSTQGTLDFSVLGLSLLFGLGGLIVGTSWVVEPLVGFTQDKCGHGWYKKKRWARDDSLQVMRMLYEQNGAGTWRGMTDSFPITETSEEFEHDEEHIGSAKAG